MNPLRRSVINYLSMRRNLGFKLHDAEIGLLDFVSFMERKHVGRITTRLALEWAQKPKTVLPAQWAKRLGFVRGFARYQSAFDPRTEIPACGLLPFRPKRIQPYLYTDREIEQLLAAALDLAPPGGLRAYKYYCLFGLLSVSGLRIGEALNLTLEDINLQEGVLTIRKTKFGKSRLVPLHSSTIRIVADYLQRRKRALAGRRSCHVFVSGTGNRLDIADVHRTFYVLSRQIGLRNPSASHGPRLHDLRHRFALKTLLRWHRCAQEIEPRLPALSTYLGHVHVADTYWYLSACPELMGLAAERLERNWREAV